MDFELATLKQVGVAFFTDTSDIASNGYNVERSSDIVAPSVLTTLWVNSIICLKDYKDVINSGNKLYPKYRAICFNLIENNSDITSLTIGAKLESIDRLPNAIHISLSSDKKDFHKRRITINIVPDNKQKAVDDTNSIVSKLVKYFNHEKDNNKKTIEEYNDNELPSI